MTFSERITKKLEDAQKKDLLRERKLPIKTKYDYSSNDYLSLSGSLRARFWLFCGMLFYGRTKCSSKYINGYSINHQKLEKAVTKAYETEDTVIFSSGYLASIGVLQGLCDAKTIVIADRHIHASWIDATCTIKARIMRFHHNDLLHLEELLMRYEGEKIVILTESVFSMQGTVVDLEKYEAVAEKYGVVLVSDNAHALGVLSCYKASYKLHIQVGTFSKACAGFGGYACGNSTLVKAIANFGRTQIYSTVLPEYLLFFNRCAFVFASKNTGKIPQIAKKIAEKYGMRYTGSGIITKEFETISETKAFQKKLMEQGVYAPVVRPPTVPRPIIRISAHL